MSGSVSTTRRQDMLRLMNGVDGGRWVLPSCQNRTMSDIRQWVVDSGGGNRQFAENQKIESIR